MIRFLLIAVIATFMFTNLEMTHAQSSRRGRFMQRLREDILNANRNSAGKQNPQSERQPTPINSKSGSNQSRYNSKNYTGNSGKTNSVSSVSQRNGFGFKVAVNGNDELYVSGVDRNGNAAQAGVRRGDRIKEIGGIESKTIQEFEEIAKIMSPGDQMEFKISRSGRDQKIMVPFGQMPKPEAAELTSRNEQTAPPESKATRRYDFAPPSGSKNMKSVLNSQSIYRSQPQTKQVSQRFTDQIDPNQIKMMRDTIEQQNKQIEQLQREIFQLRRSRRSR